MLSNLVYISRRKPECTDEEIDKILAACERNNGKSGITGILLYSDTEFVQYLEGDYEQIQSLYEKIKQDKRHEKVIFITSEILEERSFPSWQMGAKKADFDSIEFKTKMTEEELEEFNKILAGEASTQALSLLKKVFKQVVY